VKALFAYLVLLLLPVCDAASAQTGVVAAQPGSPAQAQAITIDEAIKRARTYAPQFTAAATEARIAHEDRVQARAALLPGISYTTGAIYTQPNGTPTGRFIAANAIREYVSQGVAKETLSFTTVADYRRASAAEALAKARADIAVRGLLVTVIQDYYGVIVAARKAANGQQAFSEAQRFLTISQQLERGGEVAHADVVKAQLQANDRQRDAQEATLAAEKARYALAVMIFPDFNTSFQIVDDLRFAPPLPKFEHIQELAAKNNPELKAAFAAANLAQHEFSAAVGGHLPSLTVNYFYGIDATRYAVRTDGVQNLGYQVAATLDLPLFNWGATQSKVKQAQLRRAQARVELSAAQRQALAEVRTFYSEAQAARAQLDLLRQSADLAAEGLRLTTLRYQAGEATALEIVDAQNALTLARNNYDDGEARYRIAIANLQTLTGTF
jgi:outer membrane protein TolC